MKMKIALNFLIVILMVLFDSHKSCAEEPLIGKLNNTIVANFGGRNYMIDESTFAALANMPLHKQLPNAQELASKLRKAKEYIQNLPVNTNSIIINKITVEKAIVSSKIKNMSLEIVAILPKYGSRLPDGSIIPELPIYLAILANGDICVPDDKN